MLDIMRIFSEVHWTLNGAQKFSYETQIAIWIQEQGTVVYGNFVVSKTGCVFLIVQENVPKKYWKQM